MIMNERDLEYWYDNTTILGFARMIKDRLPLRLRLFTNVYVEEKWLDNRCGVIRIYYTYKRYALPKDNQKFCCEFTLDDLEEEANGNLTITSKRYRNRGLAFYDKLCSPNY